MQLGDFTEQAQTYHRARPSYPDTLIDTLIAEAQLEPRSPVVDLGAGTGILTAMLVARGLSVTAVEPNAAMRRQASVPAARWIEGSFEKSRLAAESQAWAVAAQSFHWADPDAALPAIAQILQSQCLFSVLWNERSQADTEVLQWTARAIQRHVPDFDEPYRQRDWATVLESTGDFCCVSQHAVQHDVLMPRGRFLDLWRSHNRLNAIAGPQRFARFLDDLQAYLHDLRLDVIRVSYECRSWSARKKS